MPRPAGVLIGANRLRYFREEVLLWTRKQLVDRAIERDLSEKTIHRIEQADGTEAFAKLSLLRTLHAVNEGLRAKGRPEITKEELFPRAVWVQPAPGHDSAETEVPTTPFPVQ